jgi:hypothetical protein
MVFPVALFAQPPLLFAVCRKEKAIFVKQFLSKIHCRQPVNGNVGEIWPRASLDAMVVLAPLQGSATGICRP